MEHTTTSHPLIEVIQRLVRDANRMWAEGSLPQDSSVRLVADDLTAVQYAPHYVNGVWTACSGVEWVENATEPDKTPEITKEVATAELIAS